MGNSDRYLENSQAQRPDHDHSRPSGNRSPGSLDHASPDQRQTLAPDCRGRTAPGSIRAVSTALSTLTRDCRRSSVRTSHQFASRASSERVVRFGHAPIPSFEPILCYIPMEKLAEAMSDEELFCLPLQI